MNGHPPSGETGRIHTMPGCKAGTALNPMPSIAFCCTACLTDFETVLLGAMLPSNPAPVGPPGCCPEPLVPHVPYWSPVYSTCSRRSSTNSSSSSTYFSTSSNFRLGTADAALATTARALTLGTSRICSSLTFGASGLPFSGSYLGACWNGQGIPAFDHNKQASERRHFQIFPVAGLDGGWDGGFL